MKNSEILKLAKAKLLSEDNPDFICLAIYIVTSYKESPLVYWIEKLLDNHPTYDSWLSANHHKDYYKWRQAGRPIEARIQWINWMIRYWQRQERKTVK